VVERRSEWKAKQDDLDPARRVGTAIPLVFEARSMTTSCGRKSRQFLISNELQSFRARTMLIMDHTRSPTKRAGRPRSPFFRAEEHWSAGVSPAMRAAGSPIAVSFLIAQGRLPP
jgi:hypothetical protein